MKNIFLLTALSIAIISCSGNKKPPVEKSDVPVYELDELLELATKEVELDELLNVAAQEVGNFITVVGYVTHTCKHAGKRCFIVGEKNNISFQVEAKGDFGGFKPTLTGSKIAITGVLLEQYRLDEKEISDQEKEVQTKMEKNDSEELCAAELDNINEMRQWMKDNDKDYFVIYYMEGYSYEVLE